jgi:ABC-type glycerol-3-phosphate transport system permease component
MTGPMVSSTDTFPSPGLTARNARRRAIGSKVLLYASAILAVIVTVLPLFWMMKVALNQQIDALAMPPIWLTHYGLDNFISVWNSRNFVFSLKNSLIVACIALFLSIGISLPAAYAFSRYRFRFSGLLLLLILCTRLFPPVTLIIPFFLNFRLLGLTDTHIGLACAYIAMNVPLAIWMLKGYLDTIPTDLEYAAMVDGASRFKAATRITVPLLAPGIVVTSIFVAILSWNEFLFAMVLTGRNTRTLTINIAEFVGDTGIDWPEIMAASMIALLPVLIFTFLMQKHLASGLTGGALKG